MYVWTGSGWASTGETKGTFPGYYLYDRGWYDLAQWTGDGASGALELNGTPGYYYSSVDTTLWLDAAGNVAHSFQNGSTVAQC
jgi:hypothetical protein